MWPLDTESCIILGLCPSTLLHDGHSFYWHHSLFQERSQGLQVSESCHQIAQTFTQHQHSRLTLTHPPSMTPQPCSHGGTKPHSLPSEREEHGLHPPLLPTLTSLHLLLRPQTGRPAGQTQHGAWFPSSHKILAPAVIKNNNVFPIIKGQKMSQFPISFWKTCALASWGWFSGKATSDWNWVISSTFQLPKPHQCPLVAGAVVQWFSIIPTSPRHFSEFFVAVLTHLTHWSIPRDLMGNTEIYKNKAI